MGIPAQLKQWLEDLRKDVYHYSSTEELLKIVEQELMARLDEHYPPGQRVPPQSYSRRDTLREILEQK